MNKRYYYLRNWQAANQDKMIAARKRWNMKNKAKAAIYHHLARYPMNSHCEWCGSDEFLQRHHEDYSKPAEFWTLCAKCHTSTKEMGGKHG